jgi:hypothetical protein
MLAEGGTIAAAFNSRNRWPAGQGILPPVAFFAAGGSGSFGVVNRSD